MSEVEGIADEIDALAKDLEILIEDKRGVVIVSTLTMVLARFIRSQPEHTRKEKLRQVCAVLKRMVAVPALMTQAIDHPGLSCPTCDTPVPLATPIEGGELGPQPGNLGLCWYCGETLVFTAARRLEKLSPAARAKLPRNMRARLNHLAKLRGKHIKRDA